MAADGSALDVITTTREFTRTRPCPLGGRFGPHHGGPGMGTGPNG